MDLLIFDMDGVLIDVTKSYRKTIQQTIQIYLETFLGFRRSRGGWITDGEISLFKSAGGFNNDWDVTSGFLLYLLSVSDITPLSKRKTFSTVQEVARYLKTKSLTSRGKFTTHSKRKGLLSFLKKVKSSGGGLRGVRRVLGTSWEGWVYGYGDLAKENLIKRVFQEIYLGDKFISRYHLSPLFYRGKGLHLKEKTLIPKKILAALRKKIRMGIASGRPRFEAELTLKRFHLLPYFNSVVTLDECEQEENHLFRSTGKKIELSKPHPYSILRAIREIGLDQPQCGYVGDVVDDMLAARAAKRDLSILAIGFIGGHRNRKTARESLIKAGADRVIEDPKEFLCFIS